jgi:site-specific DNA-methyltransferase (adenine-specific)
VSLIARPAFKNETSSLFVGDCTLVMPRLPKVDTVFADPPFNIGVNYAEDGGKSDRKPVDMYREFTRRWISMAVAALRPGGTIFVHVPDEVVGYAYIILESLGCLKRNWIVLHQEFGQYTEGSFIRSKVHCLYFVKPPFKLATWNVEEVLEPSLRLRTGDKRTQTAKHKGHRPFLDLWTGQYLGRVQGNNEERWKNHENQLPEMYLARLIRATTKVGDTVLDPFTGSGTTGVVAQALRRHFIGIEQEERLAKSAWQRMQKGAVRKVGGSLVVPHKFIES